MSTGVLVVVLVVAVAAVLIVVCRARARRSVPLGGRSERHRTPASPVSGLDPESAARRIAENLRLFPLHVGDLDGKQDVLWDNAYIDGHPGKPRIRERFEVRQIGRDLHARGGVELMRRVALSASDLESGGVSWASHHLEHLWRDIGGWTPGSSRAARVETDSVAAAMTAFQQMARTLTSITTDDVVAGYNEVVDTWHGPALVTFRSLTYAAETVESNLRHDHLVRQCSKFVLATSGAPAHMQVDSVDPGSGRTVSHRLWRSGETYALFSSAPDAIAPHLPGSDSVGTSGTVSPTDSGSAWGLTRWDVPDLSHVKEYGLARKGEWDSYVPHLALVPCGGQDKPAIFLRIPHSEFSDWNTTVEPHEIGWQWHVTEKPAPYVVLSLTVRFENRNGGVIGASGSAATTGDPDKAAHRLECRAWLDPADPDVQEAVRRWATWPTPTVFYFVDDQQPFSGYLTITLTGEQRAAAVARLTEALSELRKDSTLPTDGFAAAHRMLRGAVPPTSRW